MAFGSWFIFSSIAFSFSLAIQHSMCGIFVRHFLQGVQFKQPNPGKMTNLPQNYSTHTEFCLFQYQIIKKLVKKKLPHEKLRIKWIEIEKDLLKLKV